MRRGVAQKDVHCYRTVYKMSLYVFYVLIAYWLTTCLALDEVKLGVLLPSKGGFPFVERKTLPAIEYAIETVEKERQLPNHKLVLNFRDSDCSETIGPLKAIDLYVEKSAHVFLGPVCDYAVAPIARFSPHWNIPVISAGAPVKAFDNKTEYGLLTRIQGSYAKNAEFVVEVSKAFNWSHVGLLFHDNMERPDDGKSDHFFTMEPVFHSFRRQFLRQPWYKSFDENFPNTYDVGKMLQQASLHTRIVILCASADSVREIMIKAHELNFDNGEYVFLNIDLFSSKDESEKPWERENDTEERNQKAKKAYEALMTVTLRKPISNDYQLFSDEVKRRARENDKNFTYGEEEVNSFVGAFHDAVILYALALNESLSQNMSITNGTEITRRMWNRTFTGITGTVSIDDNGDRNADYSLLDMDPKSGKFKVVANYYGNNKEYKPVDKIHWAGGRTSPPPDTPKCGFDGSKCPPSEPFPEYGIVIIVLGSLLVIFLIAAFFIYRRIKLEAELAEMNWRVKWEDIMFGSMEHEKKLKRQGSTVSLQRTNGDAFAEGRVLIERGDTVDQTWCKCGSCEDSDRQRRLCCRQLELFGIFQEEGTCITSSRNFKEVVTNKEVLTSVFIHVMLVRRQRGAAPMNLSPCKFRLMAIRQFLCWMHRGQKLKKESRMTVPSCVSRAIRLAFPDETGPENSFGRGSCTTTTTCLAEIMPLDT